MSCFTASLHGNPLENGRGDRFVYDNEGQLTDAWYEAVDPVNSGNGATRRDQFHYDQLGNRQGQNTVASLGAGAVTIHRRDNGLNQYLDWTQSAINYENNGNLYQDGWISASYNALNQPITIWSSRTNPTGYSINFGHDPLGRCVKRWTGPASDPYYNPATYFEYDGWNLIQEGSNCWAPAREYVHGARVDEIVYSLNNQTGDQAFHHYDARGNCTLLTDSLGNISEQYAYDAFGYPYFYNAAGASLPSGSTFGNRFLFTGREWIKEIAVYDFRARHYLPELGRFIQPDPQEFSAGDYNLYRYCHNDPVNKSDPMGLEDIYVSPEMDRLGSQAAQNSYREYIARGRDGYDRSQLVQQKNGELSLQPKFNVGEIATKSVWKDGRVQKQVSQRETAQTDKGSTSPAVGHMHADVTGQPAKHDPNFSTDDKAQARSGTIVYKVNESNPSHVTRLTPQTDGSAAVERKPVLPILDKPFGRQ